MNFFRLLHARLLFPVALCVCSFAAAQDSLQQQNEKIRISVDHVTRTNDSELPQMPAYQE